MCNWSRGVTAGTLDSESSDRGSNLRETCCAWGIKLWGARRLRCAAHQACGPPLLGPPGASSSVAEPLAVCRLQELVSSWSRGATVSTLDSESSDRGSNPREAFARMRCFHAQQASGLRWWKRLTRPIPFGPPLLSLRLPPPPPRAFALALQEPYRQHTAARSARFLPTSAVMTRSAVV